jgi:hypothetical protein
MFTQASVAHIVSPDAAAAVESRSMREEMLAAIAKHTASEARVLELERELAKLRENA